MAGSRKKEIISHFYCINCGKEGIPIWRNRGRMREQGHLKALYCTTCKLTINHVEIRTEEEKIQFFDDFAAGKYTEAAERSKTFVKEHFDAIKQNRSIANEYKMERSRMYKR